MNALHVFPEQMTQRLAWGLVHFVWQGAAVGVLLAATLWLGSIRRPSTRYACCLIALLVMAACPVVTFVRIQPAPEANESRLAASGVAVGDQGSGLRYLEIGRRESLSLGEPDVDQFPKIAGPTPLDDPDEPLLATDSSAVLPNVSVASVTHEATPARSHWSQVQPWIVSGWLLGVAALSLRLLLGWIGISRLRRRVEPVPEWLGERVEFLAQALRVTRPLIHLSHRVTEAIAVGFLRPMILLPVAWVSELPPDMIEAVLAHELAHIRRGDLWVNLLQRLVETLLFYHPAVWWLSRRLRIERELCCDELVVRTMQNPLRYAETLEHIGRLSLADSLGLAHPPLHVRSMLTVSIGSPRSILLTRIRAILNLPAREHASHAWLAGLIPLTVACLIGWSLISRNTAPASDDPSGATGGGFGPPVLLSRDDENTGGPKPPPVAPAIEPPAPSNDIRTDNLVEAAGTYRGRVVTEDGSPLPADLKLMRRVSSEQTRATPVDPKGEFSFGADPSLGSVRFSMTATGFAPFDSSWLKLDQPLALTLSRGAAVKLRLVPPAGSGPVTGTAALIVPWWDEDEQGTFPVDANGMVTITRCPKATVKIDALVSGFEEVRVHRWVRGDVSLDVPLQPAKPTRLRIVSAKDGSPVAGAKVRLFSRTRAGSFLTPFQYWGDGPVWGESNADGRVELTTLRAVDPVPTNDPGAAVYAFRIDAPNHAPCYIGDVRAGSDLGEIHVGDSLEVRGEIARDAVKPERISLQIRQPTVAQGGKDGRGGWKNIEPTEVAGKLTFHLKGLQAGPFDMFIVYSDASEPPNSLRGTIKQLQFHGLLTGSSSNLIVTRESVVPGDKLLTARRTSLFPIDDHPPSNVPNNVSKLLVAGWHTSEEADGKTALQENKPTLQPLFVWSSTSPVQHSMGHVDWRVFVLQDGTVFIPGGQNYEAGTHHKLPVAELQELKNLLEKHRDLFGRQVPKELPQFAGWRHGHENLSYTKDGETKAFVKWYGLEQPPMVGEFDTAGSHKATTEFISRLMTDAACGGRQAKAKYRELANKALTAVLPKATPFNEATWTNTVNGTDGTRTIRFANTDERTEVTLIHSAFGEVYVERIEQFDKRIALDAPLPAQHGKADTLVVRDQELRAEQKRVTDLDPVEWKRAEAEFGLLMDLVPLREREMPLCWRMLGWAEVQPFAELQRRTERDASPEDLYTQPDKSRGRPVRLRLHIRRLLEWEPPENPLGVKRMYEAWGSASDTSVVPCVVIFTELPAGMKVGEEVRIDGDFAGYFLKVMSYSAQDGKKRGVPLLVGRLQHRAEQEAAPEKPPGDEAPDPDRARRTNAVERAAGFLKSQQREDGTWQEMGSFTGGVTALATVALLQAGVMGDDAVIQKALPGLRTVEPKMIYVVALQTMVLCIASPKDDAELIRRNVTWIENAQVKEGNATGGWSYLAAPAGRADGSCSRFAILALDAAKRAKFEVRAETWQRVATYWLKSQKENGCWGYVSDAPPTFSMTLAGVAGLATAHRHLPKDEQAAAREAAMRKPHEFIAKTIPLASSSWPLYSFHCLERAGHLTDTVRFGDVDWKSVVTKRLIDHQRHDGAWVGPSASENELIATSFALMFLSGRPEAPVDGKRDGGAKPVDEKEKPKEGDLRSEPRRGQETRAEQSSRAEQAEPKPGQTGHGVVLTVRGRVMIDGPIPEVPPLKIKPTFRAIIPRNREEDLRNEERERTAPVVEIPDDSLVLSKEGGIANVAIYLKKAPRDWKPSAPPSDPVVIEAVERRFSPHMIFIRAGQSLMVKNSLGEAANFHSLPIHASEQNVGINYRDEKLIKSPYTQSERLPNRFGSGVHPWMSGYLLALDHPFAAITDTDGRFEIRDLPPGEHHFTVWHERRGYLNKDLVVRVEDDKVSEVNLRYTAEQLARLDPIPATINDTAKQRAARLKASDREAAAKLVGQWMLTLPTGFVFEAEVTQTGDGCVKLGGKQGNNPFGKFAVKGDRLELVEPTDKGIVDLVWQVKSNNLLTLIVDQNNVGATYLGAKLERLAAE